MKKYYGRAVFARFFIPLLSADSGGRSALLHLHCEFLGIAVFAGIINIHNYHASASLNNYNDYSIGK